MRKLIQIYIYIVLLFYYPLINAKPITSDYNNLGSEHLLSSIPVLDWVLQGGVSGGNTKGYGIYADDLGNIYISGTTDVGLSGQIQNGINDYFIAKYDMNGNLIWNRHVGTFQGVTQGEGVSTDENGKSYIVGLTTKGISGQKQTGYQDYFVVKYLD